MLIIAATYSTHATSAPVTIALIHAVLERYLGSPGGVSGSLVTYHSSSPAACVHIVLLMHETHAADVPQQA